MLTVEQVRDAVRDVTDPELRRGLLDLGMIKDITVSDGRVELTLALTTMGCPRKQQMVDDVKAAIEERIARGEEDDDARPWLKRVLASLQEEEDAVADFLQQHSPGETVTAIMPKKSLPDLYQSLRMEGADVEEAKRVVAEYLKNRKVFMLLARSGRQQWLRTKLQQPRDSATPNPICAWPTWRSTGDAMRMR